KSKYSSTVRSRQLKPMALFHPIAVQAIWPSCCSGCCSAFVSLPVQSRSGPCSKAWQALHSLYSIIPAAGARTGEHAQPNEGNSRRSTMTRRLLCVSGQRRKRRRQGPAWDSKAAPVLLVHIFQRLDHEHVRLRKTMRQVYEPVDIL